MKKDKPAPMPAWVLHDLRRSLSTGMHERPGILPHIVEDVLGHATFSRGSRASTTRPVTEPRSAVRSIYGLII